MKLPGLLAAVLLLASSAFAAETRPLNVLHIVSDDLNVALGCYGHPVVKSPNLDRLAARAVRFDGAYCNYPVCNPSRTSFMSGKRPDTTRVVTNDTPTRAFMKDTVMLPELFRHNGYRVIKVGKIYHTGGDQFEDKRSWDIDIRENNTAKSPPEEQIKRKPGHGILEIKADDKDTWDGFVARKAVEYLEETVRAGKPFYLAAGFRRPHTPYIAPEKYYALYQPESLVPRWGPPGHAAKLPKLALSYNLPKGDRFPREKPGEVMQAYYAAISFMDAQVGVLLDAMDRLKLWDSTVVVFHGDHGYHLGEHEGLWHKLNLFEETTRVPLIVAAPGRKPAVASGLVELVDLYPTIAGLAGLKAPADLEGTSFAPLLDQPARAWKKAVFTVISRDGVSFQPSLPYNTAYIGRTVFDGRWRYTEWPDGGKELYDHKADGYEYVNLAADPKHAAQLAEMKKLQAAGWKAALPAK